MRPQLYVRSVQNDGVFLRRDAVECGYTPRELRSLTRPGGDWVTVRRGCYAERSSWERLTPDGRYAATVRAARLGLADDVVLSHVSAAVLLEMPLRPAWRELVHVTRPGVRGSRVEHGIKHHIAGLEDSDLTSLRDRVVTNLARTAADIGRELGFVDGVVAADAALRLGATVGELRQVADRMACWPSTAPVRAAVKVADAGAENVGESLARLLIMELGIGRPQTQFRIEDDGWVAVADLRVGRHLFEFDGRVKYVGRESGGVAERPLHEVVWAEKRREDRLRSLGWGVSRVVWDELFGQPRQRARVRLLQEYAETVRRLGIAA